MKVNDFYNVYNAPCALCLKLSHAKKEVFILWSCTATVAMVYYTRLCQLALCHSANLRHCFIRHRTLRYPEEEEKKRYFTIVCLFAVSNWNNWGKTSFFRTYVTLRRTCHSWRHSICTVVILPSAGHSCCSLQTVTVTQDIETYVNFTLLIIMLYLNWPFRCLCSSIIIVMTLSLWGYPHKKRKEKKKKRKSSVLMSVIYIVHAIVMQFHSVKSQLAAMCTNDSNAMLTERKLLPYRRNDASLWSIICWRHALQGEREPLYILCPIWLCLQLKPYQGFSKSRTRHLILYSILFCFVFLFFLFFSSFLFFLSFANINNILLVYNF